MSLIIRQDDVVLSIHIWNVMTFQVLGLFLKLGFYLYDNQIPPYCFPVCFFVLCGSHFFSTDKMERDKEETKRQQFFQVIVPKTKNSVKIVYSSCTLMKYLHVLYCIECHSPSDEGSNFYHITVIEEYLKSNNGQLS